MSTPAFRYRFRVRYNECDAQRVVFNARYADYVDLAMTEYMRAVGCDYDSLLAQGLDNQVVRLLLEWQAPAHFDEVIEAEVRLQSLGRTSFTLEHRMRNVASDTLLCRAEAVYVLMRTQPFEKTPIPDFLRERLSSGAPGQVVNHAGGIE